MTPRERAITKSIMLAITEEIEVLPKESKDVNELIEKVLAYGKCMDLKREEVLEVLKQPLIKLY